MKFRMPSVLLPIALLACVVSAWAGFLAGAQKSFGRVPFSTFGQTIGYDSKFAAFAGWSFAEPEFRWSEGRSVAIVVRPRRVPDEPLVGVLRLRHAAGPQSVAVTLNGAPLTTLAVPPEGGKFLLPIPANALRSFEDNEFRFTIGSPRVPENGDMRLLGIAFESLTFWESSRAKGGG